MIEYRNHVQSGKSQKWYTVVLFERMPDESPRTSKDCIVFAKFVCPGDAYAYAADKVRTFNKEPRQHLYLDAWAIVVR